MSALSGVLLVLVFPHVSVGLLVWVACLPLLLLAVSESHPLRAFWWGVLTGAVFLTGSLYWFVNVMEGYGHLTGLEALAAMLGFLVLFSPFWGLWALAESWLALRSLGLALFASPFLWVALELARTYLITGFPWNLLGYGVQPQGLEQIARVTAVYGLSFLAVATCAFLAWVILVPRLQLARGAAVVWLIALAALNMGLAPPPLAKPHRVAILLQPDVPLTDAGVEQWAPWKHPRSLEGLVNISVQAAARDGSVGPSAPLIVWPESSAPFYFGADPVFRGALETLARETHAFVVANTVTFLGPDAEMPQNSAVVLNPSGRLILEYHKIHLVPMGEYVPWWLRFTQMGKVTSQVGDFVPGSVYSTAQTPDGALAVFICYEAIFPQLVRRLTPPGPGVLINISDDAWYGRSAARFQHLNMARFRAIENHRYLLRATNDGVTAVIDPYGRIAAEAPLYRRTVLDARFSFVSGRTFYNAHGDVFAWIAVVVSAAALGYSLRRPDPIG